MNPVAIRRPRKRITLPKILAVTLIACGPASQHKNDAGPVHLADGGLDCSACTAECPDGLCEPLPDPDGGQSCQCLS
jgi:hypothetical protein